MPEYKPQVQTWQEKKAELLEVEVETCENVIYSHDRADGLFPHEGELAKHMDIVRNLMSTEVQNRQRAIEKLIGKKPVEVH